MKYIYYDIKRQYNIPLRGQTSIDIKFRITH